MISFESERLERVIAAVERSNVVEPPEVGPNRFVPRLEPLPVGAVGVGKADGTREPSVGFGPGTLKVARQLGCDQSLRHALHFHAGERLRGAECLLDIVELLRP